MTDMRSFMSRRNGGISKLEQPVFKRVVLKVSGESLSGENGYGIDADMIASIAEQVKEVVELGVEVAIVVGGGNIWRGIAGSAKGIDRATADYMGMLATVMNSLALQDALEQIDVPTRVQTSIAMQQIAEPYIRRRRFAIWKKAESLFLQQEPAIRSSLPIRQQRFAQRRSKQKSF